MKKALVVLLSFMMLFAVTACDDNDFVTGGSGRSRGIPIHPTVTVISGEDEYELERFTMHSWDADFSASGRDYIHSPQRLADYAETLPEILYQDDFLIAFSPRPKGSANYKLYYDGYFDWNDAIILESEFEPPEEPGIYILEITGTWENGSWGAMFQFFAKIRIE